MAFGIVTHGHLRLAVGLPGATFPERLRFAGDRAKFKQPVAGSSGKQALRIGAEPVPVDDLNGGDFAEKLVVVIASQVLHRGKAAQRRIEFRLEARAGKDDPALAAGRLDDPLVSFAFVVGQGDVLAGPGKALGFEPILDVLEFLVEEIELLVDGITAFDELGEVAFRL
jgi:hypothetical protein